MLWISVAVVAVVGALVLLAALRRRAPDRSLAPRWATWLIAGGGVAFPAVVLTVLWVLTLDQISSQAAPPQTPELTIEVEGHRWWWEVRYPELGIVTANELHVPVGRNVRVRITTADVLHSFWVPQLAPKVDMIAGQVNELWLRAERAGTYRGQCAEFCGLQHALMIFFVVAETPERFEQWVSRVQEGAEIPTDPVLRQGLEAFRTNACTACHTIQGVAEQVRPGTELAVEGLAVPATAVRGPDLTHFGSRLTIGAGAAPNVPGYLGGWIVNSQSIKPGNLMPPINVESEDLRALIQYLESLR